jgi:hypothetical protein
MVASSSLALVGFPAIPVIQQMRGNDESYGRNQESDLVIMKCLFEKKQDDTKAKKQRRQEAPVMLLVSVPEGVESNDHRHQDHQVFEPNIFNDVCAQDRETRQNEG